MLTFANQYTVTPALGSDGGTDTKMENHEHGEGCSHEPDSHEGHNHEEMVHTSESQITLNGIKTDVVETGSYGSSIRAPGEIKLNSNRIAHIVPQLDGMVKKVLVTQGDEVIQGQLLTIMESRTLAEAKAEYLAANARLTLAKSNFQREEKLFRKKITPEQDYIEARQVYEESQILTQTAKQKLQTLGYTSFEEGALQGSKDRLLSEYRITSPFDGTIIEKHIVLGEAVDQGTELFVIADVDTVWVEFRINQADISKIFHGQRVTIGLSDNRYLTSSILNYISPVVDPETRSILARVDLDNSSGVYRPGLFVNGVIHLDQKNSQVWVPKSSVQLIDDAPGVFVKCSDGFMLRRVQTGESNGSKIEILSGLEPGEIIVTENAFHLKSELRKSAGGCASHGHAH